MEECHVACGGPAVGYHFIRVKSGHIVDSVPQRYEEVPNGETLPLKVCKELDGKDHIGGILQVYIFILELPSGRVMPVFFGTMLERASVWSAYVFLGQAVASASAEAAD